MIIYADQVFIGSMLMNYIILYIVSKVNGIETAKLRLVGSAAIGGIYSVLLFMPSCSVFFVFWCKVLLSIIMVMVAFFPQSLLRLMRCLVFFYLFSFGLGGSVIGLMYFLSSSEMATMLPSGFSEVLKDYFWYAVLLVLGGVCAAGRGLAVFFRQRYTQNLFKVPLSIKLLEKEIVVNGYVDSGNQLTDPVSGNPVIIVEYSIIKNILPVYIVSMVDKEKKFDPLSVIESMQGSFLSSRFSLVPFRSLGADRGMLLCFRPDEVRLYFNNTEKRFTGVAVAIYYNQLTSDSNYQALVHPGLLESALN